MTPKELAQAAEGAISKARVQIVLSRRRGRGRRMVVFETPRLYGEVCLETGDGRTVVSVGALDLLAWLATQGLVVAVKP